MKPPQNSDAAFVHEQVLRCCQAARLLRHLLARTRWAEISVTDRHRLHRALRQLESDVTLAQTITGGTETTKAAAP
jgi:RNA polymerase-interacting CarD/CdnL/TRCF family regulator